MRFRCFVFVLAGSEDSLNATRDILNALNRAGERVQWIMERISLIEPYGRISRIRFLDAELRFVTWLAVSPCFFCGDLEIRINSAGFWRSSRHCSAFCFLWHHVLPPCFSLLPHDEANQSTKDREERLISVSQDKETRIRRTREKGSNPESRLF